MLHAKRPTRAGNTNDDDRNLAVAHTDHDDDDLTTADKLSGDEIAVIFSFLQWRDIMR
jgi:hypothetical protein